MIIFHLYKHEEIRQSRLFLYLYLLTEKEGERERESKNSSYYLESMMRRCIAPMEPKVSVSDLAICAVA